MNKIINFASVLILSSFAVVANSSTVTIKNSTDKPVQFFVADNKQDAEHHAIYNRQARKNAIQSGSKSKIIEVAHGHFVGIFRKDTYDNCTTLKGNGRVVEVEILSNADC